jgi:hypothetical protein
MAWAAPARLRHLEPTGCAALAPPCGRHVPRSGCKRNGQLTTGRASKGVVHGMAGAARAARRLVPSWDHLPKIPSERAGGWPLSDNACGATSDSMRSPCRMACESEAPRYSRIAPGAQSQGRECACSSFTSASITLATVRPAAPSLVVSHDPRRITSASPDDVSTPVLE